MRNIQFHVAGLFLSNGKGCHVTRKMQFHELIFVKSGTLHIREKQKNFAVHAGEYLILHRNMEHGGTADYEKKLSFFWMHFSSPDNMLQQFQQHGKVKHSEYLMQYFTMLINEQKFPENQQICDLLCQILFTRIRQSELLETEVSSPSLLAESAKRIIDLNFASPISSSSVAAELNCNTDYLGKIFHNTFNCTMTAYINKKRCQEAAHLLINSASSVKEIAFFAGFNDLPWFRRQFFRYYSVTPGQFRRMNRATRVNTMNL